MVKKKNKETVIKLSSAELAQRVVKVFSFLFYLFIFFFYIILDVYNGLNLPFQLVGYLHLFCLNPC